MDSSSNRLFLDVHFVSYDVLLSYPDYKRPNHMIIIGEDGKQEYKTKGVSPPIIKEEQSDDGTELHKFFLPIEEYLK